MKVEKARVCFIYTSRFLEVQGNTKMASKKAMVCPHTNIIYSTEYD